jgi:hypothetical protein
VLMSMASSFTTFARVIVWPTHRATSAEAPPLSLGSCVAENGWFCDTTLKCDEFVNIAGASLRAHCVIWPPNVLRPCLHAPACSCSLRFQIWCRRVPVDRQYSCL